MKQKRNIEEFHSIISTLCHHIWNNSMRRVKGNHLWSIPADPERDFDFILKDFADELKARRHAMKEANLFLPEYGELDKPE